MVFIGSALQQFSGINAVFYFSSTVFKSAGVPPDIANMSVGVVNLSGSIVGMLLMDKLKALLLGSFMGMLIQATSMGMQAVAGSSLVSGSRVVYLSVGGVLLFVLSFAMGVGPVPGLLLSEIFPGRIRAKAMAICMAVHWVNPHSFTSTFGYKFLCYCWSAVFADAGASWATDTIHSFRKLLLAPLLPSKLMGRYVLGYYYDVVVEFCFSPGFNLSPFGARYSLLSVERIFEEHTRGRVLWAEDFEKSTPSPPITGSPRSIYQPGWGVPNSCRLDTLEACQDVVDHIAPPGYFSEPRHLPNDEFLSQYNINLARQVAMSSQLRLRFEQEVKLLRKFVAQVTRRDQRIATREKHIKDLEAQLEAEINMKKAAEAKNSEVTKELEDLRMCFLGLKVGNAQLSQQVSVLQAQVMGEKRTMAAFEDFKKHEDERVNARCAEMDAWLDALSVDFDEELYPHMLTAIAGRWWVIGHELLLAVMKCAESTELRQAFANVVSAGIAKGMSEGLKYGVEHGKAGLELTVVEAYDPEADNKYVAAFHDLKDLNYPLIDELEQLKDAPLDVIMASLYLDSDTGEDAPQFIYDLRPSSSQLKIPVYPKVRNPRNPWACKDEMLLEDAIAANISRVEEKKKSRVICRTHGVGSTHHARSDGVPVSVPTIALQGLQILLADAATQTKDEGSPRLLRSKSLPAMFNVDWP
ncbi:gypsy type transposase [Tanacetum coccineum]